MLFRSASHVTAGIINYIDATHYFTAWLIRDDTSQPGFHEIELRHVFTGYSDVCHKAGLSDFIHNNDIHTFKVQFTPSIIHVFIDGHLFNSYVSPVAMGTKFGLVLDNYNGYDQGSKFDNWIAKGL